MVLGASLMAPTRFRHHWPFVEMGKPLWSHSKASGVAAQTAAFFSTFSWQTWLGANSLPSYQPAWSPDYHLLCTAFALPLALTVLWAGGGELACATRP